MTIVLLKHVLDNCLVISYGTDKGHDTEQINNHQIKLKTSVGLLAKSLENSHDKTCTCRNLL